MTLLALSSLLLFCPLQDERPVPVGTPQRPAPVYNISLLLLGRTVDDADPADEQVGWGLEFDAHDPSDIFGWEIGVARTSDDASSGGVDLDATIKEIYLGARKTWGKPGRLHPFLSAGLSFVEAEADVSGVGSDDDSSFGLYGRGGAYWTFGEHFNLGADVKALLGTDIEFGDADYFQVGIILGYSI
jgi:hypothetical protein